VIDVGSEKQFPCRVEKSKPGMVAVANLLARYVPFGIDPLVGIAKLTLICGKPGFDCRATAAIGFAGSRELIRSSPSPK
jgi:hypothetical protein